MLSGLVQTGETPLHNAAVRSHLEVAKLLLEAGTSPTIKDIVSRTNTFMLMSHTVQHTHTHVYTHVNISSHRMIRVLSMWPITTIMIRWLNSFSIILMIQPKAVHSLCDPHTEQLIFTAGVSESVFLKAEKIFTLMYSAKRSQFAHTRK